MNAPNFFRYLPFFFALFAASAPARAQNSFAEDIRRPSTAAKEKALAHPANTPASPRLPAPVLPGTKDAAADPRFAKVAEIEGQDFSIAPTDRLHVDPMHAPTPTQLPGGKVLSTEALNALYQRSPGTFLIFDVLGGQEGLPGAQNALPAGRSGSFTDETQRDFGNYLQQVTRGKKDLPLIFYCQSVQCWMSYNAALRAVNLGYTQVWWYRGGIEAWQAAGLQSQKRQ